MQRFDCQYQFVKPHYQIRILLKESSSGKLEVLVSEDVIANSF